MITYRDKFLVALDKFVNTTLFNMDAKSVVQSVETATAKTITKKSPNWVYDKIANELNRHVRGAFHNPVQNSNYSGNQYREKDKTQYHAFRVAASIK